MGEEGWDDAGHPLHAPNAQRQRHHNDSVPTGLTALVFCESGIGIGCTDHIKLGRMWFCQPLHCITEFGGKSDLLRRGDGSLGTLGNVGLAKDSVRSLSVGGEVEMR